MDVGAPAVVAAIHDATGVWVHDLPASPERILAAMGATGDVAGPAGFGGGSGRAGVEATIDAPIRAGTDVEPDLPTDPQPLRGPGPDDRRVEDGWHDA